MNSFLENLETRLQNKLEIILDRDESLWLQKSCKEWIRDGDGNMKYYHAKTITRRRKNKIMALHSSEG